MQNSTEQSAGKVATFSEDENVDPFLIAFHKYNLILKELFELQKLYGSDEDSPDMARASQTWATQLDKLVRVTPTSLAGVSVLVDVSLDPESVGPDHKLRIVALRSIGRALKQLLPTRRQKLTPRPCHRRSRKLASLGIW